MNIYRPQIPYVFRPPRYTACMGPVLGFLAWWTLRLRFRIHTVQSRGLERIAALSKEGHSILVTPNHADHADPSLLVHEGRHHGIAFHFMAAREGFERGPLQRFILQSAGAFSVDREGTDIASFKTAIQLLSHCRHPLVVFPEGEIYHHHETLDELNEGVAIMLLKSLGRLPEGRRAYLAPAVIRIRHDDAVSSTFESRLERLERHITWMPKRGLDVVERIYRLGSALVSIKEEEHLGCTRQGSLVERIQGLRQCLVEQVEERHGIANPGDTMPRRIKTLRGMIRKELTARSDAMEPERALQLQNDLEILFLAQQLYSYPGHYLVRQPSLDRTAETLFKLEEDVLEDPVYTGPRHARLEFDEPVDVGGFLREKSLDVRSGVGPLTELIRGRITEMMNRMQDQG